MGGQRQQLREVTATGRYAHRHGEREREREREERGEKAGVPVSKKQGDGSEARRGAETAGLSFAHTACLGSSAHHARARTRGGTSELRAYKTLLTPRK